jgi:hypothetical protein
MGIELTKSADTPEHAELRRNVRQLCDQFGEAYWQQRDLNRQYPEQFVAALTTGSSTSTTSNASSARRASIRSRRSTTT